MSQKTKPILFNTVMVRAILDGKKTATRRIARSKEVPPYRPGDILYVRETWSTRVDDHCIMMLTEKCPYESCETATGPCYEEEYIYKATEYLPAGGKWRPSIHMPREAARIFLRVTDVRLKMLQQITVEGILAEGVDVELPPICKQSLDPNFPTGEQREKWMKMTEAQRKEYCNNRARATYIGWCDYADRLFHAFKHTWNSTIKPADLPLRGWEANPWVWVIEFECVSTEEAQSNAEG